MTLPLTGHSKIYRFTKIINSDSLNCETCHYEEFHTNDSLQIQLTCEGIGNIPAIYYINQRDAAIANSHKYYNFENIGKVDISDLMPSHINIYNQANRKMNFNKSDILNWFYIKFFLNGKTEGSFLYNTVTYLYLDVVTNDPYSFKNEDVIGFKYMITKNENKPGYQLEMMVYTDQDIEKLYIKR